MAPSSTSSSTRGPDRRVRAYRTAPLLAGIVATCIVSPSWIGASPARAQDGSRSAASTSGSEESIGGSGVLPTSLNGDSVPAAGGRDTQSALVREADRAESEARPADALALWRRALAAAPTSRLAGRCERRIAYLSARAEGDFVPLADLLRMRKVSTDALDVARLEAFARRLDGYPPGPVRREGRELVADAWLARLGDATRGRDAYARWLAEPGLDDAEKRLAASGLARALTQLGDPSAALAAMERAGLGATTDADDLRREGRRRGLRVFAALLLALFVVGGALLGGWRGLRLRALRRAFTPLRAVAAAWVLGGPLLLASRYDHAAFDTFATLALAGAGLLVLAAVYGTGLAEASRVRRRAVAAAAFGAVVGAGFFVLDRAGFLLSLGL
jgi:hypothetical protein